MKNLVSSHNHRVESTSEETARGLRILEFLGPSGVGKTTFLNELRPRLARSFRVNLSYVPVEHQWNENSDIRAAYKFFLEVKMKQLVECQAFFDIPQLLHHYSTRLQRDFWMVSDAGNSEAKYISDEGITHLYLEEIYGAITSKLVPQESLMRIFAGRCVFHFNASSEAILNNLHRRSLELPGAVHDQIGRFGVDDARAQIKRYYDYSTRLVECLKQLDVCVIELDLSQPRRELLEYVLSFLSEVK